MEVYETGEELNVTIRELVLLMWVMLASWVIAYFLTLRYRHKSSLYRAVQTLAEPLAAHMVALTGTIVIINTVTVPFASVVITQLTVDDKWVKVQRLLGYVFQLAIHGSSISLYVFLPLAYLDHKRPGFRHLTGFSRHLVSFACIAGAACVITAIGAFIQWKTSSGVYVQRFLTPGASNSMLVPGLLAYLLLIPLGSLEIAYKLAYRFRPCTEDGRVQLEVHIQHREKIIEELERELGKLRETKAKDKQKQQQSPETEKPIQGTKLRSPEYLTDSGSEGTKTMGGNITPKISTGFQKKTEPRRSSKSFGEFAKTLADDLQSRRYRNLLSPKFSPVSQNVIRFAKSEERGIVNRQRSHSDSSPQSSLSVFSEQVHRVLWGRMGNSPPKNDSPASSKRRLSLPEKPQERSILEEVEQSYEPFRFDKSASALNQRSLEHSHESDSLLLEHLFVQESAYLELLKHRIQRKNFLKNFSSAILFLLVIFLNLCITFRSSCMPFVGAIYATTGHELDWMEVLASLAGLEKHRAAVVTSFIDVGMTVYFVTCCVVGFYPEILTSEGRQRYLISLMKSQGTSSPLLDAELSNQQGKSYTLFNLVDACVAKYIAFREKYRPLPQSTPLSVLLLHAFLLLVLSFAMPVALSWLGVGAMNVMKVADSYYGNVSVARSGSLSHIYSSIFSIIMIWIYFRHLSAFFRDCFTRESGRKQKKTKQD